MNQLSDYPKLIVRPPGPKARELVKRDSDSLSPSFTRYYPLVIETGHDCIVKDVDALPVCVAKKIKTHFS